MKMNDQILQERRKLYFQWDTDNWSLALESWKPYLEDFAQKKCLEIGGRNGSLSLLLSDYGHKVICSDLNNPQSVAEDFHKKNGFHPELISYQAINGLDIPYENEFDIIVFKSVLGGIGRDNDFARSTKAVEEIKKALKPGGVLLFAENLEGSVFHQFARKLLRKWGASWHYFSISEILKLFKIFSSFQYQVRGVSGLFFSSKPTLSSKAACVDRKIENLVPNNWCYILFGVAKK